MVEKKTKLTKNRILKSLRDLKPEFKKFSVKKIGLFGSFAKNKQNYHSDVDILVNFSEVDLHKYMGLKFLLEKKFGRKVKRSSKIPNAVSIDLRSKIVLRRKQPGHWETDNMEGKRSDKTTVSVTVERMTRYSQLVKLKNHKSETKITAVGERIKILPEFFRKTMTADNGAENTNHKNLTTQTNMAVFFCHPYHSWEKGTVENMNGRIRKFVPKGTSVDPISQEQIAYLEWKLNSTPRKCLQFLTPYEKMAQIVQEENRKC